MNDSINLKRRRLLGTTLLAGVTFADLGLINLAQAQTAANTTTHFGPLKRIDAGVLNIGYIDAGPANAPVVILLHGWPYDIHSYADVTPMLVAPPVIA